MEAVLEFLGLSDWGAVLTAVLKLALATLLGGVIGLERGKQGRAAGMRTHILVCLGSALTMMIGIFVFKNIGNGVGDPTRIAAQVVSGIGFLGVGSILIKGRFQITGLTTAAGLWATASIGLALGAGFFGGALITFVLAVLTFTVFHTIEYKAGKHQRRFGIYIEIGSDKYVRDIIDYLSAEYKASDVQVTAPRSAVAGNVGIEAVVQNDDKKIVPSEMAKSLEKEKDYVIFAIESI